MPSCKTILRSVSLMIVLLAIPAASVCAQQRPRSLTTLPKSLKTPLGPETLQLLSNELSGQMIYANLVKLAGAPWIRSPREFSETLAEAQLIHEMVREYGISTTRLEKHPGSGTFDYPVEGELWIVEPQQRLVARLEADPALIARGSRTAEVAGELVSVSPASLAEVKKAIETGSSGAYRGKIALMWSHPSDNEAKTLAAAGILGVVAFNSRERYFDPNQVVYSAGPYDRHDSLQVGFSISWRQWSELLEDLHLGRKVVVRGKARVEEFPEKFDTVYSWIPGSEPDAKGVVFTAHLFDGPIKRGANDNMSGCVIQLEILRALNRLIAAGELPPPRRTIHFLWPQEISGTYAFLKHHPGFGDRASVNLNMDMVGEGLRQNNSVFRMFECPNHQPSYVDGLARSIMNYVWRTNDIIFLPDAPRGRPGGQYFPLPMVEKNGSLDAFRFAIHPTTGGSDHICFNNPSVAVPGVAFIIWPDQWYHADTDTPDKSDPTQLKRAAFIGAACAWTAAHCTDDVVGGLADAVSEHGYLRIAEREIPRAMAKLDAANVGNFSAASTQALRLVTFGANRELGALQSIKEISSGSAAATTAIDNRLRQWELYRSALRTQVAEYARSRAVQLDIQVNAVDQLDETQRQYGKIIPAVSASVRGIEFTPLDSAGYRQYLEQHPDVSKTQTLPRQQATAVLNYVNGKRSIAEIASCVAAELDEDVPLPRIAAYLELLKSAGCVVFDSAAISP